MSCNTGISIPELNTDPCNGKKHNAACVIHTSPITILDLVANSTQEQINNAFVLAITSLINRVELLESQVETLTP